MQVFVNGLKFRVSSEFASLVFIPYTHSENWQAIINGERTRVLRANGAFLALPIPAGESDVHLLYENTIEQFQAIGFILLASLLLFFTWKYFVGIQRLSFFAVGVLVIYKSLFFLPGIRNDGIPERIHLDTALPILQKLGKSTSPQLPSTRIFAGQKQRVSIRIPERKLENLRFLAATYRQPELDYNLLVTITNRHNNQSRELQISGNQVHDNQWLVFNIPDLGGDSEAEVEFVVEFSSDRQDPGSAYSIWLDENKQAVFNADYRIE